MAFFFRLPLLALLITISLIAAAQNNKLVFVAQWLPQAQFAGYYVAREQGFYKDAGVDVEIIHPTASISATEILASGKADVASLFLTTALNNREKGIDLVNIAQLSQHSAIMFVSLKKTGIKDIRSFSGKRIGVWYSGFDEVPKSFVKKYDLNVEWVPILSTVNLFMKGGIDIMTVMYYNEYDQIYLSGVNHDELNAIFLSDFGFDIPEDGLYVLRKTLDDRRFQLKAFTEATLRGWKYASENREYAIDLVLKEMEKARVPANGAHQRWMLDKILEMQDFKAKKARKTELLPDDFSKAESIMRKHYGSRFATEYDDFFKPVITLK